MSTDTSPDDDLPEPLVLVFNLCTEAARHIDPDTMPDLHAAMQDLLKALGREMGRRLRGPSH